MDFELASEQVMLRDTARRLLSERWSADDARRALDAPPASIPDAVWTELVDMGWLGVGLSGSGSSDTVTAAVLAEEAGRALLPGPLLTSLIATLVLNRAERPLIDSVRADEWYTLAVDEPGASGPEGVALVADSGSLSGQKLPVMDAASAHGFLVACRRDGELGMCVVPASAPGVGVTDLQRLDGQSVGAVVLVDVSDYELLPSTGLVSYAYDVAAVLTAASLLGSSEKLLEITSQYAKERRQFGRPIGSFQAVSHRIADMLVAVELGRGLVYGACVALDEGSGDVPLLTSAAKAWMSESAVFVAESALQLHGGIGYTWEVDVHLHLRRARSDSVLWGDVGFHQDRIATLRDRAVGEGKGRPER